MPRKARLFVPGGLYHVYCRVARGELVFADKAEAENWISTVGSICRIHSLTVLAWCLMETHYHLVIRTGGLPLWRAMARIQVRVAQHHNRRRRVLGRLWQSRYKAKIVEDQHYFGQLIAYVHLNPVAAGIVSDPADYPNTGHAALIGRAPARLVKGRPYRAPPVHSIGYPRGGTLCGRSRPIAGPRQKHLEPLGLASDSPPRR